MNPKGRMSYDELFRKCRGLEAKIHQLESEHTAAGRFPINWEYEKWIAVPLHARQQDAAAEALDDKRRYDEFTRDLEGNKRYEEIHEGVLPEFRAVLIRYITDADGDDISKIKVWGLIPV